MKSMVLPLAGVHHRKGDPLKMDTDWEAEGSKGLLLLGPLTLATAEVLC